MNSLNKKFHRNSKYDYENGLQPLETSRADVRGGLKNEESISYYNPLQETIFIKFRNVIVSLLYFSSMNSSTDIPKCLPDEDLVWAKTSSPTFKSVTETNLLSFAISLIVSAFCKITVPQESPI